MCANYTCKKNEAKLRLREKIHVFGALPRANIRPTDLGPVIIPEFQSLACREMRWGWSVPWDRKPVINVKSETITQLPFFQPHLNQRCLLLADGFYEGGIRFFQPGEPVFCFAGLWREEADGNRYTMLTTAPNETVAQYHNRMPFIVRPEHYDAWLGEDWESVLSEPERAPLEKFQKQPVLF